jgi:hypothetical protein
MAITTALGIIGYPIGHSISPVFQQAALDHLGVDSKYQPYEVHPDSVGERVWQLLQPLASSDIPSGIPSRPCSSRQRWITWVLIQNTNRTRCTPIR